MIAELNLGNNNLCITFFFFLLNKSLVFKTSFLTFSMQNSKVAVGDLYNRGIHDGALHDMTPTGNLFTIPSCLGTSYNLA